jgi:hypothetical protein
MPNFSEDSLYVTKPPCPLFLQIGLKKMREQDVYTQRTIWDLSNIGRKAACTALWQNISSHKSTQANSKKGFHTIRPATNQGIREIFL